MPQQACVLSRYYNITTTISVGTSSCAPRVYKLCYESGNYYYYFGITRYGHKNSVIISAYPIIYSYQIR